MSPIEPESDRASESFFFDSDGLSAAESVRPDEAIGRFRIIRRLGRGGMGDVFLAWDAGLAREIALKRIRPDRESSAEIRDRFELEARITALLQHPSIVPVYQGSLEEGETFFYTMRPIEGVTLAGLIADIIAGAPARREEWSIPRRCRIFLQVAGAVAFAHSRGVIHRDLKPANVMIGPFEEVLVLDWGLAKVMVDPETHPEGPAESLRELAATTASRGFWGTPAYMSPEQLRNETATTASDIFALGLILHELLTLRSPWRARDAVTRLEAMRRPLDVLERRRREQRIPSDLVRVVQRALAFEPERRFESVTDLTRAVSDALEGRASWRLLPRGGGDQWELEEGRMTSTEDEVTFRSRGPERPFRYLCSERFSDNVRVEFEFLTRKGNHDLAVWIGRPRLDDAGAGGYRLSVLSGRRRTLSLRRGGRVVAGARAPRYEPRRWIRCVASRVDDRLSLEIDGREIFSYFDPIPLAGGYVGITGHSFGINVRNLEVHARGTSARVSCLAVPDALFNHELFEHARGEYERIASSHPGRQEGLLATFRSGLCLLETARRDNTPDMRSWLLDEARATFARLDDRSCLSDLGRAITAAEENDTVGKHRALTAALEDHRDDPDLSVVREWLLGRLHAKGREDRQTAAELLPLAIVHGRGDWGRRFVRDLVNDIRRGWEMPSFMTSRGKFRENDLVSQTESRVYFYFWTGRAQLLERAVRELATGGHLRPHHLEDAVLSLLELEQPAVAAALLDELEQLLPDGARVERARTIMRAAVLAARGDPSAGAALFKTVAAETTDRAYDSARLWLARGFFRDGATVRALRALRPLGPRDGFAREHRAWFHLHLGETDHATRLLEKFLERGDHQSGRNLSNFLYGVTLLMSGRDLDARVVFGALPPTPWPRTWTLGSHFAIGRLEGDALETWLEGAFHWEKQTLGRHARLVARARGEDTASLPIGLRPPDVIEAADAGRET